MFIYHVLNITFMKINIVQLFFVSLYFLMVYFVGSLTLKDGIEENHWLASLGFTQAGEMTLIKVERKQDYKKTFYNTTLKGRGEVPDLVIEDTSFAPFYNSYRLFKRLESYPEGTILQVRWKRKALFSAQPIIVSIEGRRGFGRFFPFGLIVGGFICGAPLLFLIFMYFAAAEAREIKRQEKLSSKQN